MLPYTYINITEYRLCVSSDCVRVLRCYHNVVFLRAYPEVIFVFEILPFERYRCNLGLCLLDKVKVKVIFTLEQAMKARMGVGV